MKGRQSILNSAGLFLEPPTAYSDVHVPASQGLNKHTGVDAALWLLLPLAVLWWTPIGGFSGDGVAQLTTYMNGTWALNPNHLLYEPIGAGWLSMAHVADVAGAIARLKRLSFLSGSLALALFRLLLASRITTSRLQANLATAWLIVPAAVLGLLLSDETEIVQLPSLVLLAFAIYMHANKPSWRAALALGVAGGLTALFYISNALICVTCVLVLGVLFWKRDRRSTVTTVLASAAGALIVVIPSMLVAWVIAAPRTTAFFRWITTYGGGKAVRIGAAGYGVGHSPRDIAIAFARAIYGSATALVDISGVVTSAQSTGTIDAKTTAALIVLLIGIMLVAVMLLYAFRQSDPTARPWFIALAIGWTLGVLAFGVYWNNSDDQFFFQLAIPLAITAAAAMRVKMWPSVIGLCCLLGWNGYATLWSYATYPRARYVADLAREARAANLLIFPGDDAIHALMIFVPQTQDHSQLAITRLAERLPAGSGVQLLRDSVANVLKRGGTVSTVSIIDASPDQNPWKYLQSLGYDYSTIKKALTDVSVVCPSHLVGPWDSNWLRHIGRSNSEYCH